MSGPAGIDPQSLMQHKEFVRAVVRSLLSDEHAVDDIVQETWLQAVRMPPRRTASLRSWLGRVAGNLARTELRKRASRVRREEAASRQEARPSTAEAAAELEQHRLVVDAVLALEEPYRAAILLRYYHALPPREIAGQLGVPIATVHSRLRRGVERMRAWFDARHGGDRSAWGAALLPLVHVPSGVSGLTAGGGAVLVKTKLLSGAIVLFAAALCIVAWQNRPVPEHRAAARTADTETRALRPAAEVGPLAEPAEDSAPPRAGIRRESDRQLHERSGGDARSPQVIVGRPARARPSSDRLAEPTVDPDRGGLRVVVLDGAGSPVEGANVRISVLRFPRLDVLFEGVTGSDGRVEMKPREPGEVHVGVTIAPRHLSATTTIVAGNVTELVVSFEDGLSLEGIVRHVARGPVAGAKLRLEGPRGTVTESMYATADTQGCYRFAVVPPGTWKAVLPEGGKEELVVAGDAPVIHDFVIGQVSLHGTVRDRRTGGPVAGAEIRLQRDSRTTTADAEGNWTFCDLQPGDYTVTVSRDGYGTELGQALVLAGEPGLLEITVRPAALLLVEIRDEEGRGIAGRYSLRYALQEDPLSCSDRVMVGSDGLLRCTRILPGVNELQLSAEGCEPQRKTMEIQEGENRWVVVLERPVPRGPVSIQGTCVDAETGLPVEGVRVTARRKGGGAEDAIAYTDRSGIFRLRDLGAGHFQLFVSQDGYGFEWFQDVEAGKSPQPLDLKLVRAATLRLVLTDAAGRPVVGQVFLGFTPTGDHGTRVGTGVAADAQGVALYRQVVPGTYRLRIKVGEVMTEVEAVIAGPETVLPVRIADR